MTSVRRWRCGSLLSLMLSAMVLVAIPGARAGPAPDLGRRVGSELSAVAVAPGGDVVVVGTVDERFGRSMLLARFGPSGVREWARRWHPRTAENGWGYAWAEDVAVAPDGSIYVAGAVNVTHIEGDAWFVRKYGPNGGLRWQRAEPGWRTEPLAARATTVATGPGGLMVVGIDHHGCCGIADDDGWVRAYGPRGDVRWTRQFEAPSISGTHDRVRDVAISALGRVYVAGSVDMWLEGDTATWVGQTVLVQKLAPGGSLIWSRFLRDGQRADVDQVTAIAAHGDRLVLTGLVNRRHNHAGKAFLARWSFGGNVVWTRSWRENSEDPWDVAVARDGRTYVVGSDRQERGFLRSFKRGGRLAWEALLDRARGGVSFSGVTIGRSIWVVGTVYTNMQERGVLWRFSA